jgi:hypothetical protein
MLALEGLAQGESVSTRRTVSGDQSGNGLAFQSAVKAGSVNSGRRIRSMPYFQDRRAWGRLRFEGLVEGEAVEEEELMKLLPEAFVPAEVLDVAAGEFTVDGGQEALCAIDPVQQHGGGEEDHADHIEGPEELCDEGAGDPAAEGEELVEGGQGGGRGYR